MNSEGHQVNSAGQYLNRWSVDLNTSTVNQNALVPIQINQQTFNPQSTPEETLLANLPGTPIAGTVDPVTSLVGPPLSSQISIYDALRTAHPVTLNCTQKAPNDRNVQISMPDPTTPATPLFFGTANMKFGSLAGKSPVVPKATICSVLPATRTTPDPSSISSPTGLRAAGQLASRQFTANCGSTAQSINQTATLNLGTYGSAAGVTQYAGTAYNLWGFTQDGVVPYDFLEVTDQKNGNVIINYNNGQTRTIVRIPLVTTDKLSPPHRPTARRSRRQRAAPMVREIL
jgi:flagellar hook protein FlgE